MPGSLGRRRSVWLSWSVDLKTFRAYLRGKTLILLVDAEAVEGAFVKGYSARTEVCELIGTFWDLALALDCSIFIDLVSTDANCADGPSRNKLPVGESLGWKTILARWPRSVWPKGSAWGLDLTKVLTPGSPEV